jgi:hypothetical protein
VFYLDATKSRYGGAHVAMEPVAGEHRSAAAGALLWVTVQVPKARGCLCSAHTQEVQVTGTGPICMRAHEMERASRGRVT